jgi:predicted Zn-dependent peptidase
MIEKLTLPNGLRIVAEHMPQVRSAAVGLWIGVGSRCEQAGQAGASHFIEHMLFKGTDRHTAGELAELMDGAGGQVNAFTTRETTCFYARVLDSHLDMAIGLLSEMFFDSLFSEADADSERNVIAEEIGMYDDTPEDLVVERLLAKCFSGALGRPVLGRLASLGNLSGASLRAFKEREYRPERLVIALCGNYSDRDLESIRVRFGGMAPVRGPGFKKSAYSPAVTVKRKPTEQNHFCLGWPGLPVGDESRYAAQLMSAILGGGMSSRLFQTVRERYGLCYSIGSFAAGFSETGLFGVSTAVGRETEKRALALIAAELEKMRQDGVSVKELDRAREMIKTSLLLSLESTSARMNRLGGGELQLGRCMAEDEVIERYDAVTRDVRPGARRLLDPGAQSFSAVGRLSGTEEYLSVLSGESAPG